MSCISPFQDLNQHPHDQPSSSSAPRIKPKQEPVDEFNLPSVAPPIPSSVPPSTVDICSEFNRLSELVRSAIPQGWPFPPDRNPVHSSTRTPNPANGSTRPEPNTSNGSARIDPDPDPDSVAIVPVSGPDPPQPGQLVVSRVYPRRSGQMVRVTNLSAEDQQYHRVVVRQTRMLFDSLRVFFAAEDDKHSCDLLKPRRTRGDCKGAQLMRDAGLWLNQDKRVVGEIPGIVVGDVFLYRMELCTVGLHGQPQAGIDYVTGRESPSGEPVATSVIVSGGYEDDEDNGDVIIYSGHGGQDKNRQVADQKLECGNLAMERSMHYGIEVRVIRGFKYEGIANGKLYVYDGLYRVVNSWFDVGKSGFGVYKFKLVRIPHQPEMGSVVVKSAEKLRNTFLSTELLPRGYVTLNLSKRKEVIPMALFNDIDKNNDPLHFRYLPTTIFPQYVFDYGNGSGCDCVGPCWNNCSCVMKNGGEFPYDLSGFLVRGRPLIFECGPHCRCPPSCRNRVSQKGITRRYEVFRSRETCWGVRSPDLIKAGSFICEYAGIVLTREQAQIFTMNGDNLIHPRRFPDRWTEWGDLSQVFSDYVRPNHPSVPPLDFSMDVSRMRNVACYISHSPTPNVMVQLVLYDHNNVSFPHLMLFAMENIPPMRQLSLDYGVADQGTVKMELICN